MHFVTDDETAGFSYRRHNGRDPRWGWVEDAGAGEGAVYHQRGWFETTCLEAADGVGDVGFGCRGGGTALRDGGGAWVRHRRPVVRRGGELLHVGWHVGVYRRRQRGDGVRDAVVGVLHHERPVVPRV